MVLSNPNSRIVYPAIFLEGLFLFGGLVYISSALQDDFGMKTLQAGFLISFYGIGGLIFRPKRQKDPRTTRPDRQMALLGGTL